MGAWLYRTEARGIQAWILASDRLKELKGGSAIVEHLAEQAEGLAADLHGETLIKAAGGATIRFPDETSLLAFAEHWPMLWERMAPGLPMVHAWAPAEKPELLFRLLDDLRPEPAADLPEAGPLLERSGRTGLPAVQSGKDGVDDRVVSAKLKTPGDPLGSTLLGRLADRWSFIDDVDDFGEGYLAVIHADGNGVGKLIRKKGSDLDWLRRFSSQLTEATKVAAQTAVASLCRQIERDDDRHGGRVQGRPILLGGDDLSFIVHARYALPFTELYLRRFAEEARERSAGLPELEGLSACAGVAFVKVGWPFHAAHALAESLCKAAKGELRAKGRSGMLFHRVTTALSNLQWEGIRGEELRTTWGGELTQGPYDLDDLYRLDRLCSAMAAVPHGALHAWLTETRSSRPGGLLRWQRIAEVAGRGEGRTSPQQWGDFGRALTELGVDPANGWSMSQPATTPIAEALTWYTLQPGSGSRLWGSDDRRSNDER